MHSPERSNYSLSLFGFGVTFFCKENEILCKFFNIDSAVSSLTQLSCVNNTAETGLAVSTMPPNSDSLVPVNTES
jgi:hypothetical protein